MTKNSVDSVSRVIVFILFAAWVQVGCSAKETRPEVTVGTLHGLVSLDIDADIDIQVPENSFERIPAADQIEPLRIAKIRSGAIGYPPLDDNLETGLLKVKACGYLHTADGPRRSLVHRGQIEEDEFYILDVDCTTVGKTAKARTFARIDRSVIKPGQKTHIPTWRKNAVRYALDQLRGNGPAQWARKAVPYLCFIGTVTRPLCPAEKITRDSFTTVTETTRITSIKETFAGWKAEP